MAVSQSSPDELLALKQIRPTTIAALAPAEVLAELRTSSQGLSSEEAALRLQVLGSGDLSARRGLRGLIWLLAIFIRPLLMPLWCGAIIAFAIERTTTGAGLLIAALINTLVAALQERKAEGVTAALHDVLPSYARVLRNDREAHVMTSLLVPGDILLLRPNDIIPADARVIQSEHLHTTNPALRGDDTPAHKHSTALPDHVVSTAEMSNMIYAGGRVRSGQGRAVVVATGMNTAIGQIAALTQRAHEEPSPLLWATARLGNVVLALGVLGAAAGYLYSVTRLGLSIEQALLVSVLFLTAAVPTGLMPGITLTLIEGARRLQQRKAIFRRLSNVETLGATTVICADNTGTLTQNEMTARELWTAAGSVQISGVGYKPVGTFSSSGSPIENPASAPVIGALLRAAVQTSTARLLPPDTFRPVWHILGDSSEAALIVAAAKAGLKATHVYEQDPQLAVLSRDRRLPFEGVIVQEGRERVAYIKGPVADLLAACAMIATDSGDRPISDRDRSAVGKAMHRHQREAMRTFAFARAKLPGGRLSAEMSDVAHDLTLLGLVAVNDPPREEVATAINQIRAASIRTIMLTGDDTIGASSVARRCGLVRDKATTVLSGPEIETMEDAALRQQLKRDDMVLARLTPEQKVRVVENLEAIGDVVLMTGGAASDVPALKASYTGIAMGTSGNPAACAAADLILRDDNFATIAEAIAEGRAVEQRVRRLVALNLATTVVKLAALIASLLFGLPLLLTVSQQLLIDFLAGLLPGLAIGAGRPDPRLMKRRPRPTGRPLLARKVYVLGYGWFGGLASFLAMVIIGLYLVQYRSEVADFTLVELFTTNLEPYATRIATPAGLHGLIATSMYVVISISSLLGGIIIRRSAAPNDQRPLLLLFGLVGLSFVCLVAIILVEQFHPYIALTRIPSWGWIAAAGAVILVAVLERIRQRLDPIFKIEPPAAQRQISRASSANKQ